MDPTFWLFTAYGALGVFVFFSLLWLLHFPLRNASIVDVGWSTGLAGLACGYAWLAAPDSPRAWLLAAMVTVWGVRLAAYLGLRILRDGKEEGRYVRLRETWKTNLGFKFFVFFQAQAMLDVVLAVPFLLVALNPAPGLGVWEFLGVGLWLIAVGGEALADQQLAAFKKDPANRGKVCKRGLWAWSRHPNYFFEWLVWVAFAVFAMGSPWGWLGWLSPALMFYFIWNITGIPATEEQALSTKGEAYRRYQRETSAFFPWFPKRESSV
ncbi:DUF1295 domain-containing protein [Acanthopleuribacter pedis]|uniref:DUF1295 domain-containing protein n=1 Tax=Acanthopleuribacter pedis TaxID=442870 RepID=A0A8J7U5R1_9BACT|nr:DUF1295 domain-containing protein [Acanthopleuribacter pedis]MBO1321119.1 DUF1295 domain-containing protein [Acanthopleuribacter pedis]